MKQPQQPVGRHLPGAAILLLVFLSFLWGANIVAIKWSVRGVAPVFAAALRSTVASALVYLWMRLRRVPVSPSAGLLRHGAVVGVLFGLEFGCIYLGLRFTLASRSAILLYTHPFFVAAGAHLFLAGDRVRPRKAVGLALAFLGVVLLFARRWGPMTAQTLPGDLLVLAGAGAWAATTLYIKKHLAGRAAPIQTLFYQLAFSAPVLFLWSFLQEDRLWHGFSATVGLALAYQCVVVAFASYLAWFELVDRYSVSVLAAFTFFTPVFGVLLSAALLPGETLEATALASLFLVCCGMVLVNR